MLMPKRVKRRRVHRGRMKGKATKGNTITYGGGCRIALFVGSHIEGYFFGVSSFTKVCLYSYDYYDNSV